MHIILYNKHILSFLRFEMSDSVVSCVVSSVAIVLVSGSCAVTGDICVFFEPCILVVVGSGGIVGVVGHAVAVGMGGIFIS